MIPLNDTEANRYSFFPIVTISLIAANCVVFYFSLFVADVDYWAFLMKFGSTPKLIMNALGGGALSSFTSMFLHGGISHLVGNMLALWVFGRRVEDACGPWRFLAFYFFAGAFADMLATLVQQDSVIPGIGASGAIFGLMGAYLLLYPGGRIRTLVFLSFVPLWLRIRAIWIVMYFVGIQIIPAIEVLLRKADYSVSYWAHLGGFISAVFVLLFLRPEAFARYLSDVSM